MTGRHRAAGFFMWRQSMLSCAPTRGRSRLRPCLLALALALAAGPALAQQLAEPIPQRREPWAAPSRPPAQQRDAMLPCPEYGPGFFRYPGSSACIQVSGRVRGEVQFRQRGSSLGDTTGMSTRASVGLDVRIPTGLGPARVATRVSGQRDSGGWER